MSRDPKNPNERTDEQREAERRRQRAWNAANKDKVRAKNQRWMANNREKSRKACQAWRNNNLEAAKANSRKSAANWIQNNPEKAKASYRSRYDSDPSSYARRAREREGVLKQATPKWLTEDQISEIRDFYRRCRLISKETGIKHHVDHIVPLRGVTVSGLNVPWNLQIITAKKNWSKKNKFEDFDSP